VIAEATARGEVFCPTWKVRGRVATVGICDNNKGSDDEPVYPWKLRIGDDSGAAWWGKIRQERRDGAIVLHGGISDPPDRRRFFRFHRGRFRA